MPAAYSVKCNIRACLEGTALALGTFLCWYTHSEKTARKSWQDDVPHQGQPRQTVYNQLGIRFPDEVIRMSKPAHLTDENAAAFQQQSVVNHYHLRLPYPDETFTFLADLIVDEPRAILDVGTGTGEIARAMVAQVARVDAVDLSPAMIIRGKTLPDGDNPKLNWICGAAEEVEVYPPYCLITAADSLHWMDWEVVFRRFATLLTPNGRIALVSRGELSPPWQDDLHALIQRYSVMQNYQTYDLIALLEERGLVRKVGEFTATPVLHHQSIDDYIGSFHSRSSLSLERLTPENAAAFDEALRALVTPWSHEGMLELYTTSHIDWGAP
jgi:2-polyprenyl-3-methyl-5-hydroxy-6-metoxy-1,4-benzoquinol methylase